MICGEIYTSIGYTQMLETIRREPMVHTLWRERLHFIIRYVDPHRRGLSQIRDKSFISYSWPFAFNHHPQQFPDKMTSLDSSWCNWDKQIEFVTLQIMAIGSHCSTCVAVCTWELADSCAIILWLLVLFSSASILVHSQSMAVIVRWNQCGKQLWEIIINIMIFQIIITHSKCCSILSKSIEHSHNRCSKSCIITLLFEAPSVVMNWIYVTL